MVSDSSPCSFPNEGMEFESQVNVRNSDSQRSTSLIENVFQSEGSIESEEKHSATYINNSTHPSF